MRAGRSFAIGMLAPLVLLGLPLHAAAQFTLTGQLVEQLPGGGSLKSPYLVLYRVSIDGHRTFATAMNDCDGTATDCIQPDGRFTASNLAAGLYLVRFPTNSNALHMERAFNISISGDTDIGVVPLRRAPFEIDVTMGPIPSSGGTIPLTVRVRTRWDLPTLALTARFALDQEGTGAETYLPWAPNIDFTWPEGLTDSGVVALPPISVQASAPAGASNCAYVTITLRDQPDLVLGWSYGCGGKQP